jgi:hypothetical protein
MEHGDESSSTGITMFDFDNDGIKELCYRDETTLRVISPAGLLNGNSLDHVLNSHTAANAPNIIRFRQTGVRSLTGFEAPVIADVNMDGSADIITMAFDATFNPGNTASEDHSRGYVYVFEHAGGSDAWAPCPPVWNQGVYFPLQINEDLTVPAKPQSMLTPYTDAGGNEIYPYNGQWIQQPIVMQGAGYIPQVRKPDATLLDMSVEVVNASQTKVTLLIRNGGSASINAQTPVAFYDGGIEGKALGASTFISAPPVGVDIFPDEQVSVIFTLNTTGTGTLNGHLIWARIVDDGTDFPANGYLDCDMTNNTFSGSHCQDLKTSLTVTPDSVLCSTTDNALLTAGFVGVVGATTYQWYYNGIRVPDSTAQTCLASLAGEYKCFVTVGPVCRGFTPTQKITREVPVAVDDTLRTLINMPLTDDIMRNDAKSIYCNPTPDILTSPVHGQATIVNDSLRYVPNAGFVGQDSLTYSIGNNTATVRIIVSSRPDNIVDEGDCFVPGTAFAFSIRQQWSQLNGNALTGSLVGDLDGDGLPEIISYNSLYSQNSNYYYHADSILVRNGQTGTVKYGLPLGDILASSGGWQPALAAAMVDADGNGKGEIILIRHGTKEIVSYEVTGSNPFTMGEKWTSPTPFVNPVTNVDNLPQPVVADFNGDGIAEVVIYNMIYNAATGAYLGYTESSVTTAHVGRIVGRGGNQCSNFLTTADFDGDGLPEIAAGGKVYKVSFNASKTAVTCTKWSEHTSVADGFTAVADVNMDGHLDVVVVTGTTTRIQIWTPATKYKFTDITMVVASGSQGYPFIGDIDGVIDSGKKYPEICVVTVNRVNAFKYNSSTGQFVSKWTLTTTDSSGGTGITLFDFNNDGINEIVYRDEDNLRVLNGVADSAPVNAANPIQCYSNTAFEYPVIADTDGDGSANICITCASAKGGYPQYLRVYESNGTPWSTTRKVWNQVNYEPLQINEDLTVPPFSIPKNTTFGSKQPYNGALIQVPTMVNTDFDVVQISPDPAVDNVWITAVNASTSRIWVRIENRGVKNTNAALPVALYNTGTPGTGFLQQKQIGAIITPGNTYDLSFDIPTTAVNIIMSVRIQDTGTQYPASGSFLDCNYANNTGTVSGLLAVRDNFFLPPDKPSRLDVLANDYLSSCGRSHLTGFGLIAGPQHGSVVTLPDSSFTYDPVDGFLGVDSVTYYIKCTPDSSAAKAYLLIQRPKALKYVACQGVSVVLGFDAATGVQYYWYTAETGGNPVANGSNANTLTVTKDAAVMQTWWVEARYGSLVFPRYRVELELSDNCGTITPVGCAADGSVLYRGDFGGNNVSDPLYSQTPLPNGTTTYSFVTTSPGDGSYALLKYFEGSSGTWHAYEDHTIPGTDRGYFMFVNASYTAGLFYTTTIKGLCDDMKLYFSAWAGDLMVPSWGASIRPQLRFVLQDAATLETLVDYTATEMPLVNQATWRLYGFGFTNHSDSVKLSIYNNAPGGGGNDLVLDDIEIRFCAPKVSLLPSPFRTDTMVRTGTPFSIEGAYTDNGTFDTPLLYRWERNLTGNVNDPADWAVIPGTEGSVSGSSVSSVYTIPSVTRSDTGYYRLAVADAAHINTYNCRAMSDIVHLRVLDGIQPDSATVQEYQALEIDILANDALPASLFTPPFNLSAAVVQPPVAGTLRTLGTGSGSRLFYTNTEGGAALNSNIDSFRYEFTFYDADVQATVTVSASVYIYVLRNSGGFSACRGETFTVRLSEKPAGVHFEWAAAAAPSVPLGVGSVRTLASLGADSVFVVRPVTPTAVFPPGQLTVKAIRPADIRGMRWTGLVNTHWQYPGNWVEERQENGSTYESPISWTPARCVDVTIPSDAAHFPELRDSAYCNCITVQDRALLAGTHLLNYDSARVEILLKSTERDRFIMWSAPLRHMYSGDYHFKNGTTPQWGDVYMNFFQQANPDLGGSGAAAPNTFTATFGHPDVGLGLGTAFNVKVTSTSLSREKIWIFPQPDNWYEDSQQKRYPAAGNLSRSYRHRFITEEAALNPDTIFYMNITDRGDYDLVQVVNPYLAWLEVKPFLDGNTDRLSPAGYLIWNGLINEDFAAVGIDGGNRYVYTHPALSLSPGLIPPLQSFFVQKYKSTPDASYPWVRMSPKWTVTAAPSPYVLRAAPQENGILRIKATQGNRTAYTLLRYTSQAMPEFRFKEDIRTLFYDELPLTVYTLTDLREPLAINASGSFGLRETALGLRMRGTGEVRLDFTGMESFGHDVYLIDLQASGREIDLQETPYYTFVATGSPSGGMTEINNRFLLRMTYTGRGLVDVSVPDAPAIRCHGHDGHIHVRAVSGAIRRLEIYNVAGALIYTAGDGSTEYRIPAQTGIYLVKVHTDAGSVLTEKVIVR